MAHLRLVQDAGLVARLRTRRQSAAGSPGRVVAVHAARAGAGSSTLAASVALLWARVAGPVLLLDYALRGADQDLIWQVTPQHRLDEVLSGEVPVPEAWTGMPGGIRLMLGLREPFHASGPDAHAVERLLDWLSSRHSGGGGRYLGRDRRGQSRRPCACRSSPGARARGAGSLALGPWPACPLGRSWPCHGPVFLPPVPATLRPGA
jgi:hypothetical protein